MRHTLCIGLAAAQWAVMTAAPAVAQKTANAAGGSRACALLSAAEIKRVTGHSDFARRTDHMDEDSPVSSNCQYWGAVDITFHIGTQTKLMFTRERDMYAKAPARLGYTIEPLKGLGDDAYYMTTNGSAEVRAMLGETELAITFANSRQPDTKKMAIDLVKAAAAKLK